MAVSCKLVLTEQSSSFIDSFLSNSSVWIYLKNTVCFKCFLKVRTCTHKKQNTMCFNNVRLSGYLCVFLRCLIRTARRQRRLRSAAGGWRWTWGSLRCGATQSPFVAPPTPHHHRAHRAPAPTPAPWEVKLQDTGEKFQLFTQQAFHSGYYHLYIKGYHFSVVFCVLKMYCFHKIPWAVEL